jgi:hypothetical protein
MFIIHRRPAPDWGLLGAAAATLLLLLLAGLLLVAGSARGPGAVPGRLCTVICAPPAAPKG